MLFLSMLMLGLLIGFVGAGGAGLTITLLTVGFGVLIHTALAVALSSMIFTTASGALSHLRNGEVVVKVSTIVGLSGAIGSLIGAAVSNVMPPHVLSIMTGLMLLSGSEICYFTKPCAMRLSSDTRER